MDGDSDPPPPDRGPDADGAPGPADEGCTRRRVLNSILASGALATGGAVAYPLGRFLLPPAEPESSVASVVAGRVSEFPLNTGKIVRMGSRPVLLLRLADGEFRAFSAVCTHLSCRVQYRPDTRLIWCACHNGSFDLTGKNIAGPPPRPLEAYTANVRGEEVVITRGNG